MNQKFKFWILCLSFIIATATAVVAADTRVTYDFNSLTEGANIGGQDNWTKRDVGAYGGDTLRSTATGSYDGTKALISSDGGGNHNSEVSRLNDGNFSIPTFTGSEKSAYIQADYSSGYWGHGVSLGYDKNGNGYISRNDTTETGFVIYMSNYDNKVYITNGAGTVFSGTVDPAGWVTLRFVMDFTANGGEGSGTLYVCHINAGQTTFSAVSGLTDINLKLSTTADTAYNPTKWNGIYADFESSPGGIDNIIIGTQHPDADDDGDGVPNAKDAYPTDATQAVASKPAAINISGLCLWLDSSTDYSGTLNMTINNNYVEKWYDLSGSGNYATQTTGTVIPGYVAAASGLNNKPVISFDGSNDYMTVPNIATIANDMTIFVVAKTSPGSGAYPMLLSHCTGDTDGYNLYFQSGNSTWRPGFVLKSNGYDWSTDSYAEYGANVPNSTWSLFTAYRSASTTMLYYNMNSATDSGHADNINYGGASPVFYLGRKAGGNYYTGQMAEVIIFNRALSQQDIININYYLSQKWGIGGTAIDCDNDSVPDAYDAYPTDSAKVVDMPAELDISALCMWLDASTEETGTYNFSVTDTNKVATWYDLSGLGNHVYQSTTGRQPTVNTTGLNNMPVICFDGSDDSMESEQNINFYNFMDEEDRTYIAVYKKSNTSTGLQAMVNYLPRDIDFTGCPRGGLCMYDNEAGFGWYPGGDYSYRAVSFDNSSGHIAMNQLKDNGYTYYLDGTNRITESSVSHADYVDDNTDRVYLGRPRNDLSYLYNGQLAEVMIFNRALSDSERCAIMYYLAEKWDMHDTVDSDGDGVPDAKDAYPTDNSKVINLPTDMQNKGLIFWADGSTQETSTINMTLSGTDVSTWYDLSGGTKNIQDVGSGYYPTYVADGFNGKAVVSFDGSNDYINYGDATELTLTTNFTFTAWIYPTGVGSDATYGGIIINKEGEYEIARVADGTIQCALKNTTPGWDWMNTTITAPLNTWTHITLIYNGGNLYAYKNGTYVSTYNGAGGIGDFDAAQNSFRIGGRQFASQNFAGHIAEIQLYNKALSDSERTQVQYYSAQKFLATSTMDSDSDSVPDAKDAYPTDNTKVTDIPSVLSIGGLCLWLDASTTNNMTISGNNIERWYDMSGSANFAYQTSSALQPTTAANLIGTKPAISFTGGQQLQIDSAVTGFASNDITIITIVKSSGGGCLISKADTDTTWETAEKKYWLGDGYTLGSGNYPSWVGHSQWYCISNQDIGTTTARLIAFKRDYSENTESFYVDGTETGYIENDFNGTTDAGDHVYIGKAPSNDHTNALNGVIGEIIIFNRLLTASEEKNLNTYLAEKWGLQNTIDSDGDGVPDAKDTYPTDNSKVITTIPSALNIGGLSLWLDASTDVTSTLNVTLSGSNIERWYDLSGSANYVSQTTVTKQPTLITNTLNSQAIIQFTDASYLELPSSLSFASGWTVIAVTRFPKPLGSSNFKTLIANSAATDFLTVYLNQIGVYRSGSSFVGSSYSTSSLSGWYIYSAYDAGVLTRFTIDGKGKKAISLDWNSNAKYIGNSPGGTEPINDVAELIIFNRTLTEYERIKIERYLASKWGLTYIGEPSPLFQNF